jgi:hypothetical protein
VEASLQINQNENGSCGCNMMTNPLLLLLLLLLPQV